MTLRQQYPIKTLGILVAKLSQFVTSCRQGVWKKKLTTETTLQRASTAVRRAETAFAATLVAAIFLALIANVISRAMGRPLIWTDELAVHLMVWIAFLGASLGIATRSHMAVGILPGRLAGRALARLIALVDALVLAFMLLMAALIWRWLDVPGLIAAGSPAALAEATFNFVWLDPTLTLGVRKFWFWLILPLTAATGILHALAALSASLRALK